MKDKASSFDSSVLGSSRSGDSLHLHLHSYALAASAAGVTMLALARPASAEIVFTPANITIGPGQNYDLDLNNDGTIDFTIMNQFKSNSSLGNLFVQNVGSANAVAGHLVNSGGFPWAYAFSSGFRVTKAARHFTSGRATMAWVREGQFRSNWGGSWPGTYGFGGFGYLGLKFTINGKIHYGWARLYTDLSFTQTTTLTGYAYETTPSKAIKTGQEQGTDDDLQPDSPAVVRPAQRRGRRPATLGMLARGSRALAARRQSEQNAGEESK